MVRWGRERDTGERMWCVGGVNVVRWGSECGAGRTWCVGRERGAWRVNMARRRGVAPSKYVRVGS